MGNENVLVVSDHFDDIDPNHSTPPEGRCKVCVKEATAHTLRSVTMVYQILDKGEFEGWLVYENLDLDKTIGERLFKQFLMAISVSPANREVKLDGCKGKVLMIEVKHRQVEGRTYANVSAHMPLG